MLIEGEPVIHFSRRVPKVEILMAICDVLSTLGRPRVRRLSDEACKRRNHQSRRSDEQYVDNHKMSSFPRASLS